MPHFVQSQFPARQPIDNDFKKGLRPFLYTTESYSYIYIIKRTPLTDLIYDRTPQSVRALFIRDPQRLYFIIIHIFAAIHRFEFYIKRSILGLSKALGIWPYVANICLTGSLGALSLGPVWHRPLCLRHSASGSRSAKIAYSNRLLLLCQES